MSIIFEVFANVYIKTHFVQCHKFYSNSQKRDAVYLYLKINSLAIYLQWNMIVVYHFSKSG